MKKSFHNFQLGLEFLMEQFDLCKFSDIEDSDPGDIS